MSQLDETDRAILALLQYDGQMPYTGIAAEIGISEGAVRRRVKRMTDEKVPGVQRTETFMILKMYKLSYRWGEAEPLERRARMEA